MKIKVGMVKGMKKRKDNEAGKKDKLMVKEK